jgi:hypothetical protein
MRRQLFVSSDNPIENAFCRVALSVLLSFLAIWLAFVFLRASVFNSRSSLLVHARLFGPGQSVSLPRLVGLLCTAKVHCLDELPCKYHYQPYCSNEGQHNFTAEEPFACNIKWR